MKTWNPESLRKTFLSAAEFAENYANELSGRIKRDAKASSDREKELHDEHLAKWYVYDSFAHNVCLETRESFLAEARSRLDSNYDFRAPGSFNIETFKKFWRQHIQNLINEYEKP